MAAADGFEELTARKTANAVETSEQSMWLCTILLFW